MSPSDPAQHFTIRKIKPQRINQHFPHNSIETATFLHSAPPRESRTQKKTSVLFSATVDRRASTHLGIDQRPSDAGRHKSEKELMRQAV